MGRSATYIGVAETARLIRKRLAAVFPGTKFYVRSKSYSGGSSIDVSWDGVVLDSANHWPVSVRVNWDGDVLDPTPVSDKDYTRGDRYGYLPKPGAPTKRAVDAVIGGYDGKGFDGMTDSSYYVDTAIDIKTGEVLGTTSIGGGMNSGWDLPDAAVAAITAGTAMLIATGSYVRSEPYLPYDIAVKNRKVA